MARGTPCHWAPGRGTRRGGQAAPRSGQGAPSFRCLPASSQNMKVWAGCCGSESLGRALVWRQKGPVGPAWPGGAAATAGTGSRAGPAGSSRPGPRVWTPLSSWPRCVSLLKNNRPVPASLWQRVVLHPGKWGHARGVPGAGGQPHHAHRGPADDPPHSHRLLEEPHRTNRWVLRRPGLAVQTWAPDGL